MILSLVNGFMSNFCANYLPFLNLDGTITGWQNPLFLATCSVIRFRGA